MLNESTVTVLRGGHGANIRTAAVAGTTISSITLMDGRVLTATAFVDASYEVGVFERVV